MDVLIGCIICAIIGAFIGGPSGAVVGFIIGIVAIVHEKISGEKTEPKAKESLVQDVQNLAEENKLNVDRFGKKQSKEYNDLIDHFDSRPQTIKNSFKLQEKPKKDKKPAKNASDNQEISKPKRIRSKELQDKIDQELKARELRGAEQKKANIIKKTSNSSENVICYPIERTIVNDIPYEYNAQKEELNLLFANDEVRGGGQNGYEISGNWKKGWAIDLHTISSEMSIDGNYLTTRSELGEHLYQLKYRQDYSRIDICASTVASFLKNINLISIIDVVIPVPPSNLTRERQPVYEIADKFSTIINVSMDNKYLKKIKATSQLKEIKDKSEREIVLHNAFTVLDFRYRDKEILLFDDLYRSGSTLNEITKLLYNFGGAKKIYALTLTKTRTLR
jgi:competence protein ComFC